jgi:hypothetical protein
VSEFGVSADGKVLAIGFVDGLVDFVAVPLGLGHALRHLQAQREAAGGGGVEGGGHDTSNGGAANGCEGFEGETGGEGGGGSQGLFFWMSTAKYHSMLVTRICWHPCVEEGAWGWRRCATTSEDGSIFVISPLGSGAGGRGGGGGACAGGFVAPLCAEIEDVEEVVVLRGHSKAVTGLAWCPVACAQKSAWLASASFDYTAQVSFDTHFCL